ACREPAPSAGTSRGSICTGCARDRASPAKDRLTRRPWSATSTRWIGSPRSDSTTEDLEHHRREGKQASCACKVREGPDQGKGCSTRRVRPSLTAVTAPRSVRQVDAPSPCARAVTSAWGKPNGLCAPTEKTTYRGWTPRRKASVELVRLP